MTRRSLFGARLYNQIVYPLIAASVIVGVAATAVAVYFLEDLTNRYVREAARSATDNLASRYVDYAEQMLREARLVSTAPSLRHALRTSDHERARALLAAENEALRFDAMMVLSPDGRIVTGTGHGDVTRGAIGFPHLAAQGPARPRASVTRYGDRQALVAFMPVNDGEHRHVVALVRLIDDAFLASLGPGDRMAFSLLDPQARPIATTVGNGFDKVTTAQIEAALKEPSPDVLEALGRTTTYRPGSSSARLGGVTYQVWATRVALPGSVDKATFGYLVGMNSQQISQDAGRTTRSLIAMWSIVAVMALVGLGGWIARRVSDPLVALAAGARRIADGDFNAKVRVEGTNEVAELATTFNVMTDSLKDRSESLTKKVLELTTLYEMSRALGSTLDMGELLGSVLDSALRIFDLDLGCVVLRDRESGGLSIRALRGPGDACDDGAVRSSMSEWVVREGRPLIFNPDSATRRGQVDSVTGARAALCVPLISPEGTIGSITIGSSQQEYRFTSDDVRLLSTIANHVTIAIGNIELFSSLQEAYLATVRSLAAAVDAKDAYTRGHSDRVATYATLIAERLGLSHDQRIALEMAAYLHDIGKIGVPRDILLKPGRLDDSEMTQMRHHPLIGANILKPVAFPWAITPVVRHHHEAYDGTGYPAGLKGEEIPLLARILTVADSFEAMTADRPYRRGRSTDEAIEELRAHAGSQFDPRIVTVFTEILLELEQKEGGLAGVISEDISPEEARAIFAALVEGLFSSFRRLGGPRLASNVENEVSGYLEAEGMPFRVVRGRITFSADTAGSLDGDLLLMRETLRRIDMTMGRVSGSTLVEHFYADALEGLSARMQLLARSLEFCPNT